MSQLVSAADWIEPAILIFVAICSAIAVAVVIAFAIVAQLLLSLSPVTIGVSALTLGFLGLLVLQAVVKRRRR